MTAPRLVVALMGIPGSGKTTLARELARKTGLSIVDRDSIRAAMFPACRFTEAEKHAANGAVFAAVEAHGALGQGCIVDGMTFSSPAKRSRLRLLAYRHDLDYAAICLRCPVELAIERVQAQPRHPARDRDPELVREVATRFAPPEDDALVLDGRLPAVEQLAVVLEWLAWDRPARRE
ncbi:MAG: ATP-binding protein [Gammaproteobacteria bacterium]|nr:ATP-binding protein [Gammaproteobacteria bacterium]